MATTIKDIQSVFNSEGWDLERDKSNSRRFIVTKGNNTHKIKMGYSMDEFIEELKKLGVDKYIQEYDVTNAKPRSSGTRKKSDIKVQYDENVGASLKKRRKLREEQQEKIEEIQSEDIVVTPDPIKVDAKSLVENDQMAAYLDKVVDYSTKIPKQKDGYYFPNNVDAIVRRVAVGRNCFLTGKTGTGKTQFVDHLSRVIDQKVVRVNFHVGTTEQHLIGKWIVKDGQTEFVYGVLPMAMRYGWWIVFDEIDYAMPEHLSVLQPVLEGEPLLLTQNENEEIIPHENFRMFATANTKGRGDDSQNYVGTGHMNLAFLDRWSIFEFDYTKREKNVVMNIIQESKMAEQIVQYFDILRKKTNEGQIINAEFSTRRLIFLAEALKFGEPLSEALEYEVFCRYEKSEIDALKEIAYDVWDREHYFKGWKLGDEHWTPPVPEDANAATSASTTQTTTKAPF